MLLVTLTVLLFTFGNISTLASLTYTAAVVEYHPVERKSATNAEVLMENVQNYLEIIKKASNNDSLDIIVFPEATLHFGCKINSKNDLFPLAVEINEINIKNTTDRCEKDENYVKLFALAAAKHNLYLSVNLLEKTADLKLYNTNLVFDRKGNIVSKYRKINLFREPMFDIDKQAENLQNNAFQTDFGVEFAVFTCFDIFFKFPTQNLLQKGIRHFIMPSFWFSELPFLTSVQVQNMWSYKNNVVLLASGANNPKTSTTGSGIYFGRLGPAKSIFNSKETTKILISKVPVTLNESFQYKKHHDRNTMHFIFWEDNIKETKVERLQGTKNNYNFVINGSYRCTIDVDFHSGISGLSKLVYYILVDDSCALVLCPEESTNCTKWPFAGKMDAELRNPFKSIKIRIFNGNPDAVYYPNIVMKDLLFLDVEKYCWNEKTLELEAENLQDSDIVYTFGIYGLNTWKKWKLPQEY